MEDSQGKGGVRRCNRAIQEEFARRRQWIRTRRNMSTRRARNYGMKGPVRNSDLGHGQHRSDSMIVNITESFTQIARQRIDFDNYEADLSTVISCTLEGEGHRWTSTWTRQGPDLPNRLAPTSTARRRRIRKLQTRHDINSVYCPIAQHDELLLTASSFSSLLPRYPSFIRPISILLPVDTLL